MGYFPNAAVGPWGVLVIYLKLYHQINKKEIALLVGIRETNYFLLVRLFPYYFGTKVFPTV